ncbi:MAG: hypothetical protein HOI53_03920 [Francisellaceae bacterium]|jgi:hypothetical protein|nr:hypothetical protein [Francisellaceae bacterium]
MYQSADGESVVNENDNQYGSEKGSSSEGRDPSTKSSLHQGQNSSEDSDINERASRKSADEHRDLLNDDGDTNVSENENTSDS